MRQNKGGGVKDGFEANGGDWSTFERNWNRKDTVGTFVCICTFNCEQLGLQTINWKTWVKIIFFNRWAPNHLGTASNTLNRGPSTVPSPLKVHVGMRILNCLIDTFSCHLGLPQRRRSQPEGPVNPLTKGWVVLQSWMALLGQGWEMVNWGWDSS